MAGPLRWVVLFFTRPIHFSDVAAFVRKLTSRKKNAAAVVATEARPKRRAEHPDSLPAKARAKAAARPIRAAPATMRDKLDVAVTEESVDTLPAALRDELLGADKPAKDGEAGRATD